MTTIHETGAECLHVGLSDRFVHEFNLLVAHGHALIYRSVRTGKLSSMSMVKTHTQTRRSDSERVRVDARPMKDYPIPCWHRHGKLESMRMSLCAAGTIPILAGALMTCSPGENEIESSDNRYTQSGSVEVPDGQLMFAGPIASWPEGPTGMPQLPYSIFSADDKRIGASADEGAVIIHTGKQYGPRVEVTVSSVQSPSLNDKGWEESSISNSRLPTVGCTCMTRIRSRMGAVSNGPSPLTGRVLTPCEFLPEAGWRIKMM